MADAQKEKAWPIANAELTNQVCLSSQLRQFSNYVSDLGPSPTSPIIQPA